MEITQKEINELLELYKRTNRQVEILQEFIKNVESETFKEQMKDLKSVNNLLFETKQQLKDLESIKDKTNSELRKINEIGKESLKQEKKLNELNGKNTFLDNKLNASIEKTNTLFTYVIVFFITNFLILGGAIGYYYFNTKWNNNITYYKSIIELNKESVLENNENINKIIEYINNNEKK